MANVSGENDAAPPPVVYESGVQNETAGEGRQRPRRIASGTVLIQQMQYCHNLMTAPAINTRLLPRLNPSNQMTVLNCLFRMDSAVNPGVTATQLRRILATCTGCGFVMTKRVFANHECDVEGNEQVEHIDLTQDE
jgi:hypothetical protein